MPQEFDPSKSETSDEYKSEQEKYFKKIQDTSYKRRSEIISADSAAVADTHLPSREAQWNLENYYEKGYSKTSRSGAFTDKPNASASIRPNGLKFASDFVEKECRPGKYKPQQPGKVPTEQTKAVDAPKSACTIVDVCMDCLKPADSNHGETLILGLTMAMHMRADGHPDVDKLTAMGVEWGDPVNYVIHKQCHEDAVRLGQNATKLILVKDGSITEERDLFIALKYGFQANLHSGTEATLGQYEMAKRQKRVAANLDDYMIHLDKDSLCYRVNREKEEG